MKRSLRKILLCRHRKSPQRTSGISSPSRSKLMPTSTSNSPQRKPQDNFYPQPCRYPECKWRTFYALLNKNSVDLRPIRLVKTVKSIHVHFLCTQLNFMQHVVTCPVAGRTSISGSTTKPVGRTTCRPPHLGARLRKCLAVARHKILCVTMASHSSKRMGRLSQRRRQAKTVQGFFAQRSPRYIAPICGMVTIHRSEPTHRR